jgi:hypothetical protein
MVCAIDENNKTYPQIPFKELNCNNEFFIKIFIKGGS